MKVRYIPIKPLPRNNSEIKYEFDGESIHVFFQELEEYFDFSILKAGDSVVMDERTDELMIETSLPFNPIKSAEKDDNGTLYVELRYHLLSDNDEPSIEWEEV